MIGALCGFTAVDLSTDKYMPDRFGLFFQIHSISAERAEFSFMAKDYTLDLAPQEAFRASLEKLRGLVPASMRASASLAALGFDYVLDKTQNPEAEILFLR